MPSPALYVGAHANPQGEGDARPTGVQVVIDQNLVGKLGGKVILVTGCSPRGIGVETARALHLTGADVYMSVRDPQKAQSVLDDIKEGGGTGKLELVTLELDSFASVRACAADILKRSNNTMNIAVFNAGVMACPYSETKDGFERQFGTNHLGHFLLFQLLKPALLSSATPSFASRVVAVSSSGHHNSPINFDDYTLRSRPGGYNKWAAYGQSKLANVYFANELERRYGSRGIHSNSVMPGGIATPLQRHLEPDFIENARKDDKSRLSMKNTGQGAATQVWAAVGKEWEFSGGKYLEDMAVAPFGEPGTHRGYSVRAYNEEAEKRLWKESCEMVGVEDT